MRAFANILRHYNHNHQRPMNPPSSSSSSNLLLVSDEILPETSNSMGSMDSDPLCCPLARSHDDLLCNTSPTEEIERMRPDLLQGRMNEIDEVKSNHSF